MHPALRYYYYTSGGSDPSDAIETDPPESEVLRTDDGETLTMDE